MHNSRLVVGYGLGLVFLLGCGKTTQSQDSGASSFSFVEEASFCANVVSVSNPVTITARAQFLARQVTSSGLGGPGANQDIKFAEVEVLSASGSRIQCGTTDVSGNISLQIPAIAGTYILRVSSRAQGSYYNVSVLNNPSANTPYSIQASFSVSGNSSVIPVTLPVAPYNGTLEGGAFNIMDQVYLANKFIRENSTCPAQGGVCSPFTVAPKARIFWTPGLSPYQYYGHPTIALSFFAPDDDSSAKIRSGLYIQGGIQGDVNCSDTDHFDNSVILHEYGHFLEASFAKSDSPGGSHNGNGLIDPRLAWSEGWANFFQTAVQGSVYYRDTIGNSTCSGGTFLAVSLNMETPLSGQDKMAPGTTLGEGVFRELSVARELYDTMDSGGTDGGAGVGFAFVWKVFSDGVEGFRNSDVHFRNIGHFNQFMRQLISASWPAKLTAYDSSISNEFQLANTREYGLPLSAQSGANCSFNIQGVSDIYSGGSFISDPLRSNDFFEYHHDGSTTQLRLNYSGSSPSDLDLYLYKEDYVFGETSSLVGYSSHLYPESGGSGLEVIDVSGLAPGTYLINVNVNTDRLGQTATYFLTNAAGVRMCP